MGRGKQKEWARRDKKSDLFARQKNRTTNEYRQFPRLKWVVGGEAEQTHAAPYGKNVIVLKLALELSKYRYWGYLFVFKIYCSNFILEFQIICLFN